MICSNGYNESDLRNTKLISEINNLKITLDTIIIQKGNMVDEEIIYVSQELDKLINDYYKSEIY